MKRIFILLLFSALISASAFVSCKDDDGYSLNEFRVSIGTIAAGQGRSFSILLDNGSELAIVANMVPRLMVSDGDRVVVNFTILGTDSQNANRSFIRLNSLRRMLSKPLILQSFIDEDSEVREDSIGHAPINVRETFFGGRFVNITGLLASTGRTHMLNLVYDDEPRVGNDTAYLTLRHWEPDAPRRFWARFMASFPLDEVLAPGQTQRIIKLSWTDYNGQVYSRVGTFRANQSESAPDTFFDDEDNLGYEEPM